MKITISDVANRLALRRWLVSVSAVGAAVLVWGVIRISGQDDPLVKTEPLATVMQRTRREPRSRSGSRIAAARYDSRIARPGRHDAAKPCRTVCASSAANRVTTRKHVTDESGTRTPGTLALRAASAPRVGRVYSARCYETKSRPKRMTASTWTSICPITSRPTFRQPSS